MMGIRDGGVVSDWSDNGVVSNWVNWSWSNGQVRTSYLETVHGISGVLNGLDMTMSINVRISTVGDTISRATFVLLRVGVGVSIRVRAMVILTNVLAGYGWTVRQCCNRRHQQKSYNLE